MRWMYEKKKIICAAVAIVLAVLVTGVLSEKKGMLAEAKKYFVFMCLQIATARKIRN